MTDTHDLSRITILVPGKLNDHAAKRIDKTFDLIRLDSADHCCCSLRRRAAAGSPTTRKKRRPIGRRWVLSPWG